MYEINITRENGVLELTTTTTETAFVYNVPSSDYDCYNVSVYSIDYFGMRIGGPFTEVDVRCKYFLFYNDSFCSTPFLS